MFILNQTGVSKALQAIGVTPAKYKIYLPRKIIGKSLKKCIFGDKFWWFNSQLKGAINNFLCHQSKLFPTSVPGEPLEVSAKPFNSSTVVVHWKPPSDDKQNGVIRAYQIYIQPKNSVRVTFLQTVFGKMSL